MFIVKATQIIFAEFFVFMVCFLIDFADFMLLLIFSRESFFFVVVAYS